MDVVSHEHSFDLSILLACGILSGVLASNTMSYTMKWTVKLLILKATVEIEVLVSSPQIMCEM